MEVGSGGKGREKKKSRRKIRRLVCWNYIKLSRAMSRVLPKHVTRLNPAMSVIAGWSRQA